MQQAVGKQAGQVTRADVARSAVDRRSLLLAGPATVGLAMAASGPKPSLAAPLAVTTAIPTAPIAPGLNVSRVSACVASCDASGRGQGDPHFSMQAWGHVVGHARYAVLPAHDARAAAEHLCVPAHPPTKSTHSFFSGALQVIKGCWQVGQGLAGACEGAACTPTH